MLWSGWSRFFLEFPVPSVSFLGLWRPFQGHHLQLVSLTPSSSCALSFSALKQTPSIFLSFRFLLFSISGPVNSNIFLDYKFSFSFLLMLCLVLCSGLGYPFVSQSPQNFIGFFFKGRFWFMPISFISIVKFKSLAQFLVDHLSDPVMFSLIFLVSQFAAYAYNAINRFIASHDLHLQFFCVLTIFALT